MESKTNTEQGSSCIYYDGACSICTKEITELKKTSSNMEFINLHESDALPYDKNHMLLNLHAVTQGGEVLTGLDANIYMWRQCNKHRLANFMAFPLIYFFAKPIYKLWAQRRYSRLYS